MNARRSSRRLPAAVGSLMVAAGACGYQSGKTADRAAAPNEATATEAARIVSSALGPESLPDRFGFGRLATAEQIAPLDIDVRPDGRGLPPGRGTVSRGGEIFKVKCAKCHGPTATEGPNDVLVGREPREGFLFGQYTSLVRTIGNYWPFATTLYDYIHRAMPLDAPGSLQPDEVYSLAAWLLYRNEIVPEDAVMDARTLPAVRMPARDRFAPDDRRGGAEVR